MRAVDETTHAIIHGCAAWTRGGGGGASKGGGGRTWKLQVLCVNTFPVALCTPVVKSHVIPISRWVRMRMRRLFVSFFRLHQIVCQSGTWQLACTILRPSHQRAGARTIQSLGVR
jgi:hypothetical protein